MDSFLPETTMLHWTSDDMLELQHERNAQQDLKRQPPKSPLTKKEFNFMLESLPQPISSSSFKYRLHMDNKFLDRETDDGAEYLSYPSSPSMTRSTSMSNNSELSDTYSEEHDSYSSEGSQSTVITPAEEYNDATDYLLGRPCESFMSEEEHELEDDDDCIPAPPEINLNSLNDFSSGNRIRYESSDDEEELAAFHERIANRKFAAAAAAKPLDGGVSFAVPRFDSEDDEFDGEFCVTTDNHFDDIERFAAANRLKQHGKKLDSWDENNYSLKNLSDDDECDDIPVVWVLQRHEPFASSPKATAELDPFEELPEIPALSLDEGSSSDSSVSELDLPKRRFLKVDEKLWQPWSRPIPEVEFNVSEKTRQEVTDEMVMQVYQMLGLEDVSHADSLFGRGRFDSELSSNNQWPKQRIEKCRFTALRDYIERYVEKSS